MSDQTITATGQSAAADVPRNIGTFVQHGDHIDTIATVNAVFVEQRKLSFTYGGIFFVVTLGVPVLTSWVEGWYATPIWGGFTANYLFVSLVYFVFLWAMAWTYSKQADKLDERLIKMAEQEEAKFKAGEVQ